MRINFNTVTPKQIRAYMRDPNNRTDDTFVGIAFAKNLIGADFFVPIAKRLRTYFGKNAHVKYSSSSLINSKNTRRYKENLGISKILPSPIYDPMKADQIHAGTKLGKGIPLSMFVSSPGTRATINHLSLAAKRDVARQFYCHVPLIEGFRNHSNFKRNSLIVTEGLVKPESGESLVSGQIRDLQTKARAVVYEVLDSKGRNDPYATFQLANYWKDNHLFQGLILHFDTLNPSVYNNTTTHADEVLQSDKEYHAEIIVIMPTVKVDYQANFAREVRTDINFRTMIKDGLGYFQYK